MNCRVYPVRLTRNSWKIPLYAEHKCNESCSETIQRSNNNDGIWRTCLNKTYKNGKCDRFSKIEHTNIHMVKFNENNIYGTSGPLFESNKIIIPDNIIQMYISYPLRRPVDITLQSENLDGFTLYDLLLKITDTYKNIYITEENSSRAITYNVDMTCNNCKYINLKNIPTILKEYSPATSSNCSICFNLMSKDISKLPCDHIFHKKCINKWIDHGNGSCPVCRHFLYNCEVCKGTRNVVNTFEDVVIPIARRGNLLNRNPTNGIYGIYGHDFEDLFIEDLFYDRIKKRLFITIGS